MLRLLSLGMSLVGRRVALLPGLEDKLPQVPPLEGVLDGVPEISAVVGIVALVLVVVTVSAGVAGYLW